VLKNLDINHLRMSEKVISVIKRKKGLTLDMEKNLISLNHMYRILELGGMLFQQSGTNTNDLLLNILFRFYLYFTHKIMIINFTISAFRLFFLRFTLPILNNLVQHIKYKKLDE